MPEPPARPDDFSDLLRRTPTLTGQPPALDLATLPERPGQLHRDWLEHAIGTGVAEPHACVLATADAEGRPSGRVVALKDVGDGCWWFASCARSRKGRELARNPHVALTSYWPALGRQVRVAGEVVPEPPERSARDLAARPPEAQAMALLDRQSRPLADPAEIGPALEDARRRLEAGARPASDAWVTYRVTATEVEFWQGGPGRHHLRVQYLATPEGWTTRFLWP